MKNKLKNSVKKYLPKSLKNTIIYFVKIKQGHQIYKYDKNRFKSTYSKNIKHVNKKQLDARLIFHAHSLEKGLSRENMRYGFGKNAIVKLLEVLKIYEDSGYSLEGKAYLNALSTINEYNILHQKAGYNIEEYEFISDKYIQKAIRANNKLGGYVQKDRQDINERVDFINVVKNRYSVRDYDTTEVDLNKLYSAIELSMKTPTVCNRQPFQVRIIENDRIIKDSLEIQGGLTGYKQPPALMVITTDNNCYIDMTERNEGYVDGGLFSMTLLLSLEYYNIAACPLNAMFSVNKEHKIRKLLDIPENENIIMFIAVGNFKSKYSVPKSFRYNAIDITKVVK